MLFGGMTRGAIDSSQLLVLILQQAETVPGSRDQRVSYPPSLSSLSPLPVPRRVCGRPLH